MKKAIFALIGCVVLAGSLWADEAQWLTSFPLAMAQAKRENKFALLDFTGSDWCEPCIRLHNKVLSKPEFLDYAKSNLVLVVVDFPTKQEPDEVVKANNALQTNYNVDGYPTLLLLRPDGTPVWTNTGYHDEPPADMIAKIDAAKKK